MSNTVSEALRYHVSASRTESTTRAPGLAASSSGQKLARTPAGCSAWTAAGNSANGRRGA